MGLYTHTHTHTHTHTSNLIIAKIEKLKQTKRIYIYIAILIIIFLIISYINISLNNKQKNEELKAKQENSTLFTLNEEKYINKNNSITFSLKGTDNNYLSNSLTANRIVVKVGGTVVTPTTKILSTPTNITNGIQYNLTLSGIPGNGELSIDVLENTLKDKANNENTLISYKSGIIVDNLSPTIGIGTTVTYDMRNNVSIQKTNEIEYGTTQLSTYKAFPNRDFKLVIKYSETLKSLNYKISTSDVIDYDGVSTNIIEDSWENTEEIKNINVNIPAINEKYGKTYYIYIKGIDKSGNIGYAKKPIYVYSNYQVFVQKAFYNILDRFLADSELNHHDGWVEILYNGMVNNDFSAVTNVNWGYYGDVIKNNRKYKAMVAVHRGIIFSPEFSLKNYGNYDYARKLFEGVLLRDIDNGQNNSWVVFLNSGAPREQVAGAISSSQEAINTYNYSYGL